MRSAQIKGQLQPAQHQRRHGQGSIPNGVARLSKLGRPVQLSLVSRLPRRHRLCRRSREAERPSAAARRCQARRSSSQAPDPARRLAGSAPERRPGRPGCHRPAGPARPLADQVDGDRGLVDRAAREPALPARPPRSPAHGGVDHEPVGYVRGRRPGRPGHPHRPWSRRTRRRARSEAASGASRRMVSPTATAARAGQSRRGPDRDHGVADGGVQRRLGVGGDVRSTAAPARSTAHRRRPPGGPPRTRPPPRRRRGRVRRPSRVPTRCRADRRSRRPGRWPTSCGYRR